MWCYRLMPRIPWTAFRINASILKSQSQIILFKIRSYMLHFLNIKQFTASSLKLMPQAWEEPAQETQRDLYRGSWFDYYLIKMNYFHFFAIVTKQKCTTQSWFSRQCQKLSGARRTECLNTRFLPSYIRGTARS